MTENQDEVAEAARSVETAPGGPATADVADETIVADAAAAAPPELPIPPEPEPLEGDPERDIHRELLWDSLSTNRLDRVLPDEPDDQAGSPA
ncbi:hypothetical protein [Nonomuraea sp. NPDC050310]|uniref:hypothetical protein n=1 Tax=Nonomuraea sp. NPDC050310 TaxID=3154935 RepID=UPI0033BFC8D1